MLFRIFIVIMLAMILFAVIYGQNRNVERQSDKLIYVEVVYGDARTAVIEVNTDASTIKGLFEEDNELKGTLRFDIREGRYYIQSASDIAVTKPDNQAWKIEKKTGGKLQTIETISLNAIKLTTGEHYIFTLVDL